MRSKAELRQRFMSALGQRLRAWRDCERGSQLVELALVIPLLLVLLGATAEFGRFFYTYTTLLKGTRAASRYLVSQPIGTSDAAAKNLLVYGNTAGTGTPVASGLTTANVKITPAKSGGGATQTVEIQDFTYVPLFDLGKLTKSSTLSLSVNVGAKSTMRQIAN
ncbi:MAG TPA: TadE/TadG family type IV pilus assembly protein [Pyrinomonadaceae bacterium]|nr:TadE/TadG family type IV pilus assembly protein [Pyrinomonadaceae bacterium]